MSARHLVRPFLFLMLIGALIAAPLSGGTVAAKEESTTLNVVNEMELVHLLETVRQTTGFSIVWNPTDKNIRGKKVTGGTKFTGKPKELFSQFRAFLTFYGLVVIPLGSHDSPTYAVMDARQTSAIMRLKPTNVDLNESNLEEYEVKDGFYITTSIEVQHMNDLRNARNALTRIVTGMNIGNVTEVPDARSFVVTDFAPNVVAIYRLLKRMDRPSSSSSTTAGTTVAIDLEHAVAADSAQTLSALFAAAPAAGAPRGRQSVTLGSPTAPRIVADERTNRLLVTGSSEAIAKVRAAIELVDVPVRMPAMRVHMVVLNNIQADQAAGSLLALVRASPALWRSGTNQPMPSIVSHEETNALLISATQGHAESILALIEQMDRKR
ncbi:MAG: secretin N-terminal domain-containing protein [Planctomycetota bacterium]|nr:secretin N-terminal domain-containing protein [Planctomycetota bacterium]